MGISPEAAAETPVSLAQNKGAVGTGGKFYGPAVKQHAVPTRALRPERRSRLWVASEELVKPYLSEHSAVLVATAPSSAR